MYWQRQLLRRRTNSMIVGVGATVVGVAALAVGAIFVFGGSDANPQQQTDSLALSFTVLAGSTVHNTGASVINGDLGGAKTGDAITGFPPGIVNGAQHPGDATALQAKADLSAAYFEAANRTSDSALPADVGGMTLAPGVYAQATDLALTGTLTLDGHNDPNATFIFQTSGTLQTAPSSGVTLVNSARACNVFWQVGSSATLSAGTIFVGSILANATVSVRTGTTVEGRILTRSGDVDLDSNLVTPPNCETADDGIGAASASPKPGGGEAGIVTPTEPATGETSRTDTHSGASTTTSRSTTGASVPTVTTDPPATTDPTSTDPTTTETTTTATTTTATTTTATTTTATTTTETTTTTTYTPPVDPQPG